MAPPVKLFFLACLVMTIFYIIIITIIVIKAKKTHKDREPLNTKKNIISKKFIETEPYEKGFAKYYEEELLPIQEELEKTRLSYLPKYTFFCKLGIIPLIGIISIFLLPFLAVLTVPITIIFAFITIIPIFTIKKKYKKQAKNNLMVKVASFFTNFKYFPEEKIDFESFKDSNIYEDAAYLGEDRITGKYKNAKIELCDACFFRNSSSSNSNGITSNGLLIVIDMPKKINAKIVAIEKDANIFIDGKKMKPLSLEDPEIDKMLKIHTDDQIMSRVIFEPRFIEIIKKFINKNTENNLIFKDNGLRLSLYKNKCVFFIRNKMGPNISITGDKCYYKGPLFEVGDISQTCIQTGYIKDFIRAMHFAIEIIETLELNKKIKY